MFRYILLKYLNNRIFQTKSYLKKYYTEPDSKTLHLLRIELKKLKALIQLLKYYGDHHNSHKATKLINPIFKHLGRIRSNEQFHIIAAKNNLKAKILIQNQNILNLQFQDNFQIYMTNLKLLKACLKNNLSIIHYSCYQNFLIHTYGNILLQFKRKKNKPSEIHHIRKEIKNLLYLLKILEKFKEDYEILCFPLNGLDKVQEEIGKWHDKYQFIKKLSKKSDFPESVKKLSNETKQEFETLCNNLNDKVWVY